MDVVAQIEVSDHGGVLAQVGDDAQFDLAVVCRQECVFWTAWHEGATDFAAFLSAHGDVLQVGVVRTQTPRSRHGLVVGGVNQPVFRVDQCR